MGLIRRLGVVLVACLALASCSSGTDTALADAQQVCTDLGYKNGASDRSDDSTAVDAWTSAEWDDVHSDLDDVANTAARAAREDRRWDRLSNAVTDLAAGVEPLAKIKDDTLPQYDRDAAQAELDRLNPAEVLHVLDQECRKAQAE